MAFWTSDGLAGTEMPHVADTSTDKENSLSICCISFGFKHGTPPEAELLFDVRCLPNPFYLDELRPKTGLDADVQAYVMRWPQSVELADKLFSLIDFLIPLYLEKGKTQLRIAFGCTGGKHRSVTFAEGMYRHLLDRGEDVRVIHRDISKP